MIEEALLDPTASSGVAAYLPGYSGVAGWGVLVPLLFRLLIALYLLSSALSGFDRNRLTWWEVVLRLGLAVMVMVKSEPIYIAAIVAALGLIVLHSYKSNRELKKTAS